MLFNSLEFPVFFLLVFVAFSLLRRNLFAQNALLLVASYVFYGWWDVRFLFLIVVSTGVDYCAGLMMSRGAVAVRKRLAISCYLIASSFLFVTLDWNALVVAFDGLWPSLSVDWGALLSHPTWASTRWQVLAGTVIAVLIANAGYRSITHWDRDAQRRFALVFSLTSNLVILGFFKYFGFFAENLGLLFETLFGSEFNTATLSIVLPVGISFYTFQTMSYTIDVYRGDVEPSDGIVEFATFVAFFPQLVAGPIERGKHLLPQFRSTRPPVSFEQFREGSWLIVWGLFKKMFVADNLATVANAAFAPYDQLGGGALPVPDSGPTFWVALFAFALQIYGDFSGYTDIARGTARLMGFDIMLNFNLPYFSTSPSEFWRRWHISLSTWLRDYLYIGLGGNRGGAFGTYRNLMLTMLLGGLWHGARWNFVLWGAYHGFLLCAYRMLGVRTEKGVYSKPALFFMWLLMIHLTCIGWLLFRATNVTTIGVFLGSMFTDFTATAETWDGVRAILYYGWLLFAVQIAQGLSRDLMVVLRWHWFIQLNLWILVVLSLLTGASAGGVEFIYFDF